jgi:hypothetical protein
MRARSTSARITFSLALFWTLSTAGSAMAAPSTDVFMFLDSLPAPPANVAAAGAATRVSPVKGQLLLLAPAFDALKARLTDALKSNGTVGGIDLARASSDPNYAAQIQGRLEAMTLSQKMALANQLKTARTAAAGSTTSSSAFAAFLVGQRSADMAAKEKMRALLDGALGNAGARHRAIDDAIGKAVKSCPMDNLGWPVKSCTDSLGAKSIAQHRAVEEASLRSEAEAFSQAKSLALAEVNKGRTALAQSNGTPPQLLAWALEYVEILQDYGKSITLRAGFWAHVSGSDFSGSVTPYIGQPGDAIIWPLRDAGAYAQSIAVGL